MKFLAYRGTFKRLQGGVSAIFSPAPARLQGGIRSLQGGARGDGGACVCVKRRATATATGVTAGCVCVIEATRAWVRLRRRGRGRLGYNRYSKPPYPFQNEG